MAFQVLHAGAAIYKFSFFPRTVWDCNEFPHFSFILYWRSWIRIRIVYWWHINWHTFTRVNKMRGLFSRFHQWCESRDAILRTFSRGYSRCRECIPISNSFRKETMPISISPSIWDEDCITRFTGYSLGTDPLSRRSQWKIDYWTCHQ